MTLITLSSKYRFIDLFNAYGNLYKYPTRPIKERTGKMAQETTEQDTEE